jgi:hypothetical protein
MEYRLRIKAARTNNNVEIVALASKSLDTPKQTPYRYFTGDQRESAEAAPSARRKRRREHAAGGSTTRTQRRTSKTPWLSCIWPTARWC